MEDYDADRAEVLARAREAGVTHVLCPAVGSATHGRLLELCDSLSVRTENSTSCVSTSVSAPPHPSFGGADDLSEESSGRMAGPQLLPMMGVHPTEINDNPNWRDEVDVVEKYLAEASVGSPADSHKRRFCAVGEVGLDLHWSRDFLAEQTAAFECQLDLALEHDLPVAIHSRDAWGETLAVLERYGGRGLRGVMHAFSGGWEEYRRIVSLGDFVFGVGGPVTYKKNLWPELLPRMSREHIVLETDAPWLAPVPMRGRRNEPAYLTYIRDAVAAILDVSPSEVDRLTTSNAVRVFSIDN